MPDVSLHSFGETLLEVKDLSLSFDGGESFILKGVNAEIKNVLRPGLTQGQIVGLLGPSGVGKTQLLRLLAGLGPPSGGKVTGQVLVTDQLVPVQAGMVGVVPQNYPIFDHRTVMGNLMVAGKMGGHAEKDSKEKAEALLERFGLMGRKDHYSNQLSGGQRQRVAICRQLMCSEHFLIMDEPTSGLDPETKDACCQLITEVAALDELMTIIVITHDIGSAIQMCDQLWLLGRDRDENGGPIPGAYVKRTYNLVERGLTWHPDVTLLPEYTTCRHEVRMDFRHL